MKLIQSVNPVEIYENLSRDYINYLCTSFHVKDPELEMIFLEKIKTYNFINGPILEATPPFTLGCMLKDLANEGVLNPKTVEVILEALPYLKDNALYLHQEKAIRKVADNRNIIISSGTSSGKTECFLIPIINRLFEQYDSGVINAGTRALLLYPMNALVNDQVLRLRKISEIIYRKYPKMGFTFGRYVGDTQEKKNEALKKYHKINQNQDPVAGELLSREEMRASPPHILITNYAMLEYLLLRPTDFAFFDGNQAQQWQFLVLDEAHTYNGATGIEMSMLLARLKDRICGGKKGVMRCIATSASLFSDEKDFRKVVLFASDLFGEQFEWDQGNPNKQDLVVGERNDLEDYIPKKDYFQPKLELYSRLKNILNEYLDQIDTQELSNCEKSLDNIKEILKEGGVPEHFIKISFEGNQKSISNILYNIFQYDERIILLKRNLRKKPVTIDDLLEIFNVKKDDKEAVDNIINLIDIGAYARNDILSLPLMPARYHLFIRQPDGLYCSFYPKRDVFLERHDTNFDNYPVFEIVTCKRCGQAYIVGNITNDNKLRHTTPKPLLNKEGMTKRYFYIQDPDSSLVDDEDEILSGGGIIETSETGDNWKLCTKCGQIWKSGKSGTCGHADEREIFLNLIEVIPKDLKITKCLGCGYFTVNIVREFRFQQDAPASVFLTTLFSQLKFKETNARKILCFSDSRQDAAFFATYFESTYKRLLTRRLIYEAIQQLNDVDVIGDYRLESLHKDVLQIMMKNNFFLEHQDTKEKKRAVWAGILQEFFGEETRTCLEGTGLLTFFPIFPESWVPLPQLIGNEWNFTREECKLLYILLIDTLRLNKVISYPLDAPSPEDAVFARFHRNREYFIRAEASDVKKSIYSFLPSTNHINSRLELIEKICNLKGGITFEKNKLRELLGEIWEDIVKTFQNKGIEVIRKSGQGYLYRLDYRFWKIEKIADVTRLFYCDQCRRITAKNLRGICTTFGCHGKLIACSGTVHELLLEQNHYRSVYQHMPLLNMVAHEHTAQLQSDYGSEIQQKFIHGEINILSCSTTFELGVDLGDLDLIFLRNMPPEPANYLQRSGRAGRRTGHIGFTTTLARNRSHDLYYFLKPREIIAGIINPPILEMRNEKIIRRHIHSTVFASFFKQYPKCWTTLDTFFDIREGKESHTNLLKKYLASKPERLLRSLKQTIPQSLQDFFQLDSWGWVPFLVSDIANNTGGGGLLNNVELEIKEEYASLADYIKNNSLEIKQLDLEGGEVKKIKKYTANIEWAQRRQNTLSLRRLIDFLATKSILPKYGFPVDVVELSVLSQVKQASQIQLERDLRMAISEFAPGSQVVANGYLWKSYAIKTLRTRTWPVFQYGVCLECGTLIKKSTQYEQLVESQICSNCGAQIPANHAGKFIIPIFGFTTARFDEPEIPGESRPKRQFSSRPYFSGCSDTSIIDFSIKGLKLDCEYSSRGELTVITEGGKFGGFWICSSCGFASHERLKNPAHKNAYGNDCNHTLRGPLQLGHVFTTDILKISFKNEQRRDWSFWFSLLYAILEGASQALGIRRQDIDGCIYMQKNHPSIILYDSVPGGAGLVKQLTVKTNVEISLKKSLEIVENCTCGIETSCHGCLRNYENEFCHDLLRRNLVVDFLQPFLK